MIKMSEKRLASDGDSFVDLTQMETVDLLNKLSDENTKLHKKVDEQQAEIERLNKELIKAITKSIPPKKYEDIDKKHKPWKYVNTNCD